MLGIDLLKLLKNKINYIFILGTAILLWSLVYKESVFVSYFDISREIYIYQYLLKLVLVFVVLMSIVNIILSYREDFSSKVINIIYNSKTSIISYVLVKYLVHSIYFFVVYLLQFLIIFSFYIFKKEIIFSEILSEQNIVYLVIIFISILLLNAISLIIVTIFNNTNLALALTFLFLFGSKFIVSFLSDFNYVFSNLKYTFIGIFNYSFDKLSYDMVMKDNILNITFMTVNVIVLLLFTVLFNKIKSR